MPYYSSSGQFGAGLMNPQFGSFAQQSPTPWAESWWQQTDPTKAIEGAQNDIKRQSAGMFNSAANRLGAMGMGSGRGTPAQNAFGGIATDASRQMAEVANKYTYDAANQEANRRAGAWDAGQNRELAWNQQKGNWKMSAEQQQQALRADWWQRMQQALMAGGTPEYMAGWQTQNMPAANQYSKSLQNPWL